jgi:type 1 fimbria pilin
MLKLDAGSMAKGVAVGLENQDGSPLKINVASPTVALQAGDMALGFQAYVQGEPDALINRRIGHGQFTATTTFLLDYM